MSTPTSHEPPFRLQQLAPASPPQRRRRRLLWLGLAVAVVVVLAGGGFAAWRALAPKGLTVTGSVTITNVDGYTNRYDNNSGTTCVGDGGYSDIHGGTQVVLTDSTGAVVAIGTLATGKKDPDSAGCEFRFDIRNVPRGKGFYGIQIGNERRGALQYAEADLGARPIDLSLGR